MYLLGGPIMPFGKYHGMEQAGPIGTVSGDNYPQHQLASSSGNGEIAVFARAKDGTLAHKLWNGTSWTNWQIGPSAILGSSPAAVYSGANKIDVFARGLDDSLWQISLNATNWGSWKTLGDQVASAPAAISSFNNNRTL